MGGSSRADPGGGKRAGERLGQPGGAESAGDDADQRDPDLHGREHATGLARGSSARRARGRPRARAPLAPPAEADTGQLRDRRSSR